MIDIHELRIDSLVLAGIMTEPIRVFTIDYQIREGFIINRSIPISDIHPIPLTSEVLSASGFMNLLGDFDKHSNEWHIEETGFTIFLGSNFAHLHRFRNWVYNYAYTGKRSPDCMYLHQLQNLYFSLTGKELIYSPTIK